MVVGTAATPDQFGLVGGDFGVARYTSAGLPDPGFGTDGKVITNIAGRTDLGYAVAVQADGKIVVAGRVANTGGDNPDIGVVRYETDGTPDAGFGAAGIVRVVTPDTWDEVAEMAIQPDGNIVVTGRHQLLGETYRFMVARFDPLGNLDLSFGGTGIVTDAFSTDNDFAEGMALQADGKIIAVGQVGNLSGNPDFAIERFNTDGTLDMDFGTDGRLTVDFFGAPDVAYAVTVQADGKIVVAGAALNGVSTGVGLVRVLP